MEREVRTQPLGRRPSFLPRLVHERVIGGKDQRRRAAPAGRGALPLELFQLAQGGLHLGDHVRALPPLFSQEITENDDRLDGSLAVVQGQRAPEEYLVGAGPAAILGPVEALGSVEESPHLKEAFALEAPAHTDSGRGGDDRVGAAQCLGEVAAAKALDRLLGVRVVRVVGDGRDHAPPSVGGIAMESS